MDLAHFWFQAPAGGGGYQIGNSLRFRGSSHLSFTPSSTASTRRQMTFSFWSKHDGTYNIDSVFASGTGGAYDSISYDGDTCSTGIANGSGGGLGAVLYPAARLRDPSAWRHYVMVLDTPNATAGDRLRIYINGERITAFASSPYAPDPDPGQNFDTTYWNTTAIHRLGATATSGSANRFFSGYLAEVHCVFGSALSPTDFGEYNADGVWVPKKVSGLTYGTNGFYLDFSDPADIGADRSGNGNNFTPTGFELTDTTSRNYDWMADGPTNNYSTWNPLAKNSGLTLANANLKANGADHYTVIDTIGFGPGSKIYAEVTLASTYNPAAHGFGAGITTDLVPKTSWGGGWPPDHWWVYNSNLTYYYPTSAGTFPTIFSANCVIQIAADYDTGEIWFGVNNVWRKNDNGTTTAPDAGGTANQIASYGGKTAFLFIDALHDSFVNCGQLPFKYTPPTGFEPLSTAELPDVAITNPSDHFQTILDTGANILTNAQATFPNGLWWIKDRANTNNHQLLDSVRGGTKTLHMSTDNELATYTAPSGNSVAWCWNKGPYMDIVTWTGTGAVRTIPHSLGKVPGMIWIKNLEDGRPWVVYHKAVGNDRAMQLSQIDQQTASSAQFWNNTDPTTTEFSVGTHPTVNQAGKGMIAYVFPEVPGYSSFGKYVGNGSADGPFCYTGHRPALVMAKGITDSTEWITFDSARDPYNPCIHQLRNNQKEGEQVDAAQGFDLLSNGFKIRSSYGSRNASGQQYLWIAFAEHPFGGANVSPSPAR